MSGKHARGSPVPSRGWDLVNAVLDPIRGVWDVVGVVVWTVVGIVFGIMTIGMIVTACVEGYSLGP